MNKISLHLVVLLLLGLTLLITAPIALQLVIFKGGKMTRSGVSGTVEYSIDGSLWTSEPEQESSIADPWYARIRITGPGYSGPIVITWKLVDDDSGIELLVKNNFTDYTLSGSAGDIIYCTSNGLGSPGYNWGPDTSTPDTYYIETIVQK